MATLTHSLFRLLLAMPLLLALGAHAQQPTTITETSTATRAEPLDHVFKACASPTEEELKAIQLQLQHSTENMRRFHAYDRPLRLFWQSLMMFYRNRRTVCSSLQNQQGPSSPRRQDASAETKGGPPIGCQAYNAASNAYYGFVIRINGKIESLRNGAQVTEKSLAEDIALMGRVKPPAEEQQAHPREWALVDGEIDKLEPWIQRVRQQGKVDIAPYEEERRGYANDINTLDERFADCNKPKVQPLPRVR